MNRRLGMGIAIFVLLGAGMAWLVVSEWRSDSALDRRGRGADATLVEIRDNGKRPDLYIVRFTTAEGEPFRTKLWQPPADPKPAVGDTMRVIYDPRDPELVRDARSSHGEGR